MEYGQLSPSSLKTFKKPFIHSGLRTVVDTDRSLIVSFFLNKLNYNLTPVVVRISKFSIFERIYIGTS